MYQYVHLTLPLQAFAVHRPAACYSLAAALFQSPVQLTLRIVMRQACLLPFDFLTVCQQST